MTTDGRKMQNRDVITRNRQRLLVACATVVLLAAGAALARATGAMTLPNPSIAAHVTTDRPIEVAAAPSTQPSIGIDPANVSASSIDAIPTTRKGTDPAGPSGASGSTGSSSGKAPRTEKPVAKPASPDEHETVHPVVRDEDERESDTEDSNDDQDSEGDHDVDKQSHDTPPATGEGESHGEQSRKSEQNRRD